MTSIHIQKIMLSKVSGENVSFYLRNNKHTLCHFYFKNSCELSIYIKLFILKLKLGISAKSIIYTYVHKPTSKPKEL